MTEIWLVRHGQTDWNVARRYQGQSDIPLNAVGIEQARQLAKKLINEKFDAIYCSDLIRAQKTAQIVAEVLHMPIQNDQRLREICKGIWEGLSFDEIQIQFAEDFLQGNLDPVYSRTPGGESVAEVAQRAAEAVSEYAARYPAGRLLIISHGLAISTLNCQANNIPLNRVYDHIPENATPIIINWK